MLLTRINASHVNLKQSRVSNFKITFQVSKGKRFRSTAMPPMKAPVVAACPTFTTQLQKGAAKVMVKA